MNRDYKPLGFNTHFHVIYEDHPIEVKFKNLTEKMAVKLSCDKSPNLDTIYLYDDRCNPSYNKDSMKEYMKRLSILADLAIEDIDDRLYKHFIDQKTGNKYEAYDLIYHLENHK